MKRLLFKLLSLVGQKTVLEYVNETLTRPDGGNDLELAFLDDKGRSYFRYPDGMMPVVRMGAIQTYTSYLAVALTPELINNAFEDVKGHLAHGDTLKAGAVLSSLQEFQRNCVNIDAFLNILAASYVREDENPNGQDARVHAEKLAFLESKIDDTAFFFKQRESRELFKKYGISIKAASELHKNYRASLTSHQSHLEAINGTKYTNASKAKHTPLEDS